MDGICESGNQFLNSRTYETRPKGTRYGTENRRSSVSQRNGIKVPCRKSSLQLWNGPQRQQMATSIETMENDLVLANAALWLKLNAYHRTRKRTTDCFAAKEVRCMFRQNVPELGFFSHIPCVESR